MVQMFATDSWNRIAEYVSSRTDNKWALIALELPDRTGLHVKNRSNWLVRHKTVAHRKKQMSFTSAHHCIVEKKRTQIMFEPITFNEGRFGSAFQESQTKMFAGCNEIMNKESFHHFLAVFCVALDEFSK